MANPLYEMLMNGGMPAQQPSPMSGMMFQNPMQKVNYIMQALRNPAAFVRQQFPDIPNEITNDPNQILNYLKNTRGLTDQQIQEAASQIPPGMIR